jgi:thiamine biosynthesis lipoprotein
MLYQPNGRGGKPLPKNFVSPRVIALPTKQLSFIVFVMACVVSCSAFGIATAEESQPDDGLEGYDFSFPSMGSTVVFSAYSPSEVRITKAFEAAKAEVERLSAILTDYDPSSELSQLHGHSEVNSLSDDLFQVLLAAEDWHRESHGGFDVAIGNLTRLWRAARKRETVPSSEEIRIALQHSGWQHVELNREKKTLRLLDPEVRIDLGGIAAGFIVDRAFEVIQSHGLQRCLINAAGDIRCGAAPPRREGWKIEVASLAKSGPAYRRILLVNASITTSGDLWQSITVDGIRRSHIIDPRIGYGVPGPTSLTLIAESCLDADAGATALCVMSRDQGRTFLEQHSGWSMLRLTKTDRAADTEIEISPNFPKAIDSQ